MVVNYSWRENAQVGGLLDAACDLVGRCRRFRKQTYSQLTLIFTPILKRLTPDTLIHGAQSLSTRSGLVHPSALLCFCCFLGWFLRVIMAQLLLEQISLHAAISCVAREEEQVPWLDSPGEPHEQHGIEA